MIKLIKYAIALLSTLLPDISNKDNKKRIHVLMYHKIVPADKIKYYRSLCVSPEAFEEQIKQLQKDGYHFISYEQLLDMVEAKKDIPPRAVFLTFDDGSVDNYQYAFNVLKKYNVPALIFLTTGYIDTEKMFWWEMVEYMIKNTRKRELLFKNDKGEQKMSLITEKDREKCIQMIDRYLKTSDSDNEGIIDELSERLEVDVRGIQRSAMNWEEIKEMMASGVRFGAHTINHVNLAKTDNEIARNEICGSKEMIENKLDVKVEAFAYPYGTEEDYLPIHLDLLKKAKFRLAFTTVQGTVKAGDDPLRLKRIHVSGEDDMVVFRSKFTETYPWIWNKVRNIGKRILK